MDYSNGNKLSNSTAEITNGIKEIDLNSNNDFLEDEASTAPFEILAEFLSTLLARDYKTALVYCKLILQYEPNNKIVQDFYPLLQQKINIEAEEATFDHSPTASDENENKDSDDSAEYYSSTSGREDEEGEECDSSSTSLSSSSDDDNSL